MSSPVKPFIFLHIPKTGGVTFHNILTNQYRFEKHFLCKLKELAKWNDLSAIEKLKYAVVKGHFPFGGEHFYPGKCTYFTFLRDPAKRIVSHYQHIKSTPSHKLFSKVNHPEYSLAKFLQNGDALLFDNCFVRFLSGAHQKKWGEINESDLALAIENFDKYFAHFGLVEEYDKSLLMLTYELGWKTPYYVSLNKSKPESKFAIDQETETLITRFSKYDKILWEHAQSKFYLKVEKYKTQLEHDLEDFRQKNKRNLFIRTFYYGLKDKIFRKPF